MQEIIQKIRVEDLWEVEVDLGTFSIKEKLMFKFMELIRRLRHDLSMLQEWKEQNRKLLNL
jgi:hypothetical protein